MVQVQVKFTSLIHDHKYLVTEARQCAIPAVGHFWHPISCAKLTGCLQSWNDMDLHHPDGL